MIDSMMHKKRKNVQFWMKYNDFQKFKLSKYEQNLKAQTFDLPLTNSLLYN